jgi:hypothetical protein
MKTQTNTSNLKKMAVIVVTAIVMTTGSIAQPSAEKTMDDEMIALNRLSVVMDRNEESLRYTAPTLAETEEVEAAIAHLDELTAATEQAVSYEAPEVIETVVEMERLDDEMFRLEASVVYKAPVVHENTFAVDELTPIEGLVAANR